MYLGIDVLSRKLEFILMLGHSRCYFTHQPVLDPAYCNGSIYQTLHSTSFSIFLVLSNLVGPFILITLIFSVSVGAICEPRSLPSDDQ